MLGSIPYAVLAVGFAVQLVSVLLSAPYTPHNFAKSRDPNHKVGGPLKIRRVLLLTAHPDDEAMFFGPTLVGLNTSLLTTPGKTEPVHETASQLSPKIEIPESLAKTGEYEVYSLCLSPGGTPETQLAETRKRELGLSLGMLGIPKARRWVLDRP